MNLYEYVALKNPNGAKNVVNSFGQKAIRRTDILAKQLANTVNSYGKDALFRIASVHPDLELISEYKKQIDSGKEKENCDCKKSESIFSSAEGQEIKKAVESIQEKQNSLNNQPKESKSESKDLLIIGAVVLVALALVMNK